MTHRKIGPRKSRIYYEIVGSTHFTFPFGTKTYGRYRKLDSAVARIVALELTTELRDLRVRSKDKHSGQTRIVWPKKDTGLVKGSSQNQNARKAAD